MSPQSYFIWTIGCQMNVADSERVAALLESADFAPAPTLQQADVVILNSCVVRQSAEDKVAGELGMLKGWKARRPGLFLALMGCMVTDATRPALAKRYPQVDAFFNVLETSLLLERVGSGQQLPASGGEADGAGVEMGPESAAPWYPGLSSAYLDTHTAGPTAYVPVIYGCNMSCSFCIIPARRGSERSRPMNEILAEVRTLVSHGTREITFLGQTVDAYGHDLPPEAPAQDAGVLAGASYQAVITHPAGVRFQPVGERPRRPDLADLLAAAGEIPELWRLRFLTSHPLHITDRLITAVAQLPKVCPCINIPVQAGHDDILKVMRRGYTVDSYRRLVDRLRQAIPGVAVTTDLIVGFPGETDEHFAASYRLVEETAFDVVHVAAFSPRPGTVAAAMPDDVPRDEKKRRLQAIEALQEGITRRINEGLVGRTVQILVEGQSKGKWMGRTTTDRDRVFRRWRDMDGDVGERAPHPGWSVVLAGRLAALRPAIDVVRPGVWLAAAICLYLARTLPGLTEVRLPAISLRDLALPTTLAIAPASVTTPMFALGLVLIVFCWWLPHGQWAALWLLLPLLVCAVTLPLAHPLAAVCGLALALAAMVAPVAESKRGGVALFAGMALLGTAALALATALLPAAAPGVAVRERDLAQAAMAIGFGLVLGVAPLPFWLPGLSQRGQAAGAALIAALVPVCAFRCGLALLKAGGWPATWLLSEKAALAIVGGGLATAILAAGYALWQRDARRLLGCLLAADLGLVMVGLGAGLWQGAADQTVAATLVWMVGRSLAVLALFPCLAFFTVAQERRQRLALLVLLAAGAWLLLGGPGSVTYAYRRELLEPVLAHPLLGRALLAALALSLAAAVLLLVRAWQTEAGKVTSDEQPQGAAVWLALAVIAAVVVVSVAAGLRPETVSAWSADVSAGWLAGR